MLHIRILHIIYYMNLLNHLYLFDNIYLLIILIHNITYYILYNGGARGVMVIFVGNGHGDTSSNPGRD